MPRAHGLGQDSGHWLCFLLWAGLGQGGHIPVPVMCQGLLWDLCVSWVEPSGEGRKAWRWRESGWTAAPWARGSPCGWPFPLHCRHRLSWRMSGGGDAGERSWHTVSVLPLLWGSGGVEREVGAVWSLPWSAGVAPPLCSWPWHRRRWADFGWQCLVTGRPPLWIPEILAAS